MILFDWAAVGHSPHLLQAISPIIAISQDVARLCPIIVTTQNIVRHSSYNSDILGQQVICPNNSDILEYDNLFTQ